MASSQKRRGLVHLEEILKSMEIDCGQSNVADWIVRGKTIRELIDDLRSFENQDLKVEISLDSGKTHKPISMVVKDDGVCVLVNYEAPLDDS